MTIPQVASQLIGLSVGGYINGEKFTVDRLTSQIAAWFSGSTNKRIVMEIALPDGRWFFTVNHYAASRDGFDYTIPETREQEAAIRRLIEGPEMLCPYIDGKCGTHAQCVICPKWDGKEPGK